MRTNNENETKVTKRGPGRPRKTENSEVKRGPGRPRKTENSEVKRGPGRPRKNETAVTNKKPSQRKNKGIEFSKEEISSAEATQMNFFELAENVEPKMAVYGLAKISSDIKKSMVDVTDFEARFLVDTYYQVQTARMSAANQIRSIVQGKDDNGDKIPLALTWVFENMKSQEAQIKSMLDFYTDNKAVGYWLKKIVGIGPVLAAGLLSNFDFDKAPHYGNFVSFCGLNDYNNPWLGKEGGNKVAEAIYTELLEEDSTIIDRLENYGDTISKAEFAKMSKSFIRKFKNDIEAFNNPESILDIVEEKVPGITELYNSLTNEDPDRANDFIIRSFINDAAITDIVKYRTASTTNRTLAVVNNGIRIQLNNDKKALYGTKTHLKKYLAKPPYSAQAKQLIYLVGESFVKFSNNPNSLYGKIYKERKAYEITNNENGVYAERAAEVLHDMNYDKNTESYKAYIQGKLPPAHIHRRSKRFACRLLLSHLHGAMYADKYGKEPNKDDLYPMAILNHEDYIAPEIPYRVILDFNERHK